MIKTVLHADCTGAKVATSCNHLVSGQAALGEDDGTCKDDQPFDQRNSII